VTIICLSFLTIGIFLSLSNNLKDTARELANDMTISFFLEPGVGEEDVAVLREEIALPAFVEAVEYVSPDQAIGRFSSNFPELTGILSNLKTNPFPASIEARLKNKISDSGAVLRFVQSMREREGIAEVQFKQDWVEKMEAFSRLAGAIGMFLGGILILASFFIISNVIKLNVFARKNEIEILRLVGSTNLFIRVPFWLEGIALGLMGSLLSLALLAFVINVFPLYVGPSLGAFQQLLSFRYPSWGQALLLLAGGAGTGLMGSATSVSKFLRV
jgi:cell division transport system permease protein